MAQTDHAARAPYTDPDGHPSWQPSPEVRAMDAAHRRARLATRVSDRYLALEQAEAAVLAAREALAAAIMEQAEHAADAAGHASQQYRSA